MLSKILICVVFIVIIIAAVLLFVAKYYKSKCSAINTKYELLNDRYNALENNYATLQASIKAKQEVENEKDKTLSDIASGSVDDSIKRLQNRNRKRNNENGGS